MKFRWWRLVGLQKLIRFDNHRLQALGSPMIETHTHHDGTECRSSVGRDPSSIVVPPFGLVAASDDGERRGPSGKGTCIYKTRDVGGGRVELGDGW